MTATLYNTAAEAKRALAAAGYALVTQRGYTFWNNDNVPSADSCMVFARTYEGKYKVFAP